MQFKALQPTTNSDIQMMSIYLENQGVPRLHTKGIGNLASLVRNRISKYGAKEQQKTANREWIKHQGMNIQPLIEYLTHKPQMLPQVIDQDAEEQKNIGKSVVIPIIFNHEEYLSKGMKYSLDCLLKRMEKYRQLKKRRFKKAMLQLEISPLSCQGQERLPISTGYVNRDLNKRNKYIQAVKSLLQSELNQLYQQKKKKKPDVPQRGVESSKTAIFFYQRAPHKIWEVLYKQVKSVNFGKNHQELMTDLLTNSLRIVQQQFSEELPLNKNALTYFLQQRYLNKMQGNGLYQFHPEHGSIWGKIFLYFRAGKLKEVAELLDKIREVNFLTLIQTNEQSIRNGRPEKIRIDNYFRNKLQDVFRLQILYALGGQCLYASDTLTNPANMDCLWVLLRNIGVYYSTDSQKFEQVKTQMMNFYSNNSMTREFIYHGAYLLDYESVVTCSENQILDKDDLVHLLIVLSRYPTLIQNKLTFENRLTQKVLAYSSELAKQGIDDYVYYLTLIPKNRVVQQVSWMISSNKLYSNINWSILQRHFSKDLFSKLLMSTSEKYVQTTGNYLEAAACMVKQISARNQGLQLLTQMLAAHIMQTKIFKAQQINKGLRYFSNWIKDIYVNRVYLKLFKLLNNCVQLNRILINRQTTAIDHYCQREEDLIFLENINYETGEMLEKLKQMKALDVFFIYVASLQRAYTIKFGSEEQETLHRYKVSLYTTVRTVANDDRFREDCFIPVIRDLIIELGTCLIEPSFENYASYT